MKILICPYCGDEKTGDELGCCGESRAHFEEVESDAEPIVADEYEPDNFNETKLVKETLQ